MRKIVISGLGLITSIGNDKETVTTNLRELRHGIRVSEEIQDSPKSPIHVLGEIPDFNLRSTDPEDWTYPARYQLRRETLRPMGPASLYAYCAMVQAIEDARLDEALLSDTATGLYTANAGSPFLTHNNLNRMDQYGILRCTPMCVVAGSPGTVTYNMVATFKIRGPSCGYTSACASSAHAMGHAWDALQMGRIERALIVGAEDGNRDIILGFAAMRALSRQTDPNVASRPFDTKRDGFVGTGGATVLVLETEAAAKARGATIYAEFKGWGQASDGYNVAIPHPEGDGLIRAMEQTLHVSGLQPDQVDHINAHATSTPIGDGAELKAIRKVFGEGDRLGISSTKALTGHGLSMTSAMEAALTALSIYHDFTPGSAHITELDPEAKGLNVLLETRPTGPVAALTNSSGFGGANVCLALTQP